MVEISFWNFFPNHEVNPLSQIMTLVHGPSEKIRTFSATPRKSLFSQKDLHLDHYL